MISDAVGCEGPDHAVPDDRVTTRRLDDGTLAVLAEVHAPDEAFSGTLVVILGHETAEAGPDTLTGVRLLRSVLAELGSASTSEGMHRRGLDDLVTSVATRLMPVQRGSLDAALTETLRDLQAFLGVDTAFLRRNDHAAGVTVLVKEWPPRRDVPDPDPLGVVPFHADPVFAATRELRAPFVQRPEARPDEYPQQVRDASGVDAVSLAMVPLLGDRLTEGVLGFINSGDRAWSVEETNALQAIASLLTQTLSRIGIEDSLRYQAYHDALTGLGNRRELLEALERRCGQASADPVTVLFLGLDHLKDLNDALGHKIGDRFLLAIADRLRTLLRPGDIAGRIGGDEFLVILESGTDGSDAYAIAERLARLAAEPVDIGGRLMRRTISVGIAQTVSGRRDPESLLGDAAAALSRAKRLGRDQVVASDHTLRAAVEHPFDQEELLRRAIDHDELELHYQPEVNLRTGNVTAVEALVRWNHPTRGLLTAAAFIDTAEETGLISDLGAWVLDEAARQAARWAATLPHQHVPVRVNISPLQLRHPGLCPSVAAALADHGLAGNRLSLEITEHAIMEDVDEAIKTLQEVRELGVTIALDDFGTGHSSLAQLKRLPLDFLKIDQSFVATLGTDPSDRKVIQATIQLGAAFSLDLIAEGVETAEQARDLLGLGCVRAQGYLFSPALPASTVGDAIRHGYPAHAQAAARTPIAPSQQQED